jgi:hypothetical protein
MIAYVPSGSPALFVERENKRVEGATAKNEGQTRVTREKRIGDVTEFPSAFSLLFR